MTRFFRPTAWLVAAIALVALALLAFSRRSAAPPLAVVKANPDVRRVASADTDFGFRLLARLAPDKSHPNVFFSPFSISQALTLVWNGAGGATQTGIGNTLGLTGLSPASVNAANGLLLPSLEDPDPQVKLSVANALWIRQGLTFKPSFRQTCRQFYGADTMALNFGDPGAADTINGWVKDHTQGKIDQIVSSEDLESATAVLTDAVYFHGQWTTRFDKVETQEAPFTLANGTQKAVPLMSQGGRFSYLQTPQFQAIRLPYGQGRLAMYVFLPKSGTGLDGFLPTATAAHCDRWLAQMRPTELTLFLPRFHADNRWLLRGPLSQMGVAKAFGAANFAPMGLPTSRISEVIHKATLDVDEEGTTATAATAVIMTKSARAVRVEVRVDHPFLCAIRDDATGTVLFLGAIRDPQKAP